MLYDYNLDQRNLRIKEDASYQVQKLIDCLQLLMILCILSLISPSMNSGCYMKCQCFRLMGIFLLSLEILAFCMYIRNQEKHMSDHLRFYQIVAKFFTYSALVIQKALFSPHHQIINGLINQLYSFCQQFDAFLRQTLEVVPYNMNLLEQCLQMSFF